MTYMYDSRFLSITLAQITVCLRILGPIYILPYYVKGLLDILYTFFLLQIFLVKRQQFNGQCIVKLTKLPAVLIIQFCQTPVFKISKGQPSRGEYYPTRLLPSTYPFPYTALCVHALSQTNVYGTLIR